MKSLLNKNLMQFVGCMLVLLVLVTPLFYLTTEKYYAEEMIEAVDHIHQGKTVAPSDMQEDIVEGMVLQLVTIFAVLSISMLLVMHFLTRRLWKPFDDTLQKIEHFNLESSDVPAFIKSGTTEFERLNHSVEKLMCKDKEIYRSQKEFTENASHELQTPIAIIQSKLDLLMQEHLNQNQAGLVADMYSICNRLSRLNRNLFLLAKIENEQFKQTEKVNLKCFVESRKHIYDDLIPDGKILVEETSDDMTIVANVSLLESMLDNLVVNGIRHKPDMTDLTIRMGERTLTVVNPGLDDTPLDQVQLFKRFHNAGDRKRGNGLGLAIVKAICDFHHWTVRYHYDGGCHYFTVSF